MARRRKKKSFKSRLNHFVKGHRRVAARNRRKIVRHLVLGGVFTILLVAHAIAYGAVWSWLALAVNIAWMCLALKGDLSGSSTTWVKCIQWLCLVVVLVALVFAGLQAAGLLSTENFIKAITYGPGESSVSSTVDKFLAFIGPLLVFITINTLYWLTLCEGNALRDAYVGIVFAVLLLTHAIVYGMVWKWLALPVDIAWMCLALKKEKSGSSTLWARRIQRLCFAAVLIALLCPPGGIISLAVLDGLAIAALIEGCMRAISSDDD